MIPDEGQAQQLHRKYGSNPQVVRHCEAAAKVARILVRRLLEKGVKIDENAVVAAALLHDIGRTRTHTVHHGHVGAEMMRDEGVDDKVVRVIQKHVGAGISSEEANGLGFPDGDYVPRTIEERVVCFADKMIDGNRVRPFDGEVKRFVAKGHDVKRLKRLKEILADDLGEDPEEVIFSSLGHSIRH